MKVALLLFGFLRSYKHNYQNLKDKLLDKYKCDIFVYISEDEIKDDRYINNNTDLLTIIKTVNDLYKPISFICDKNSKNSELEENNKNNKSNKNNIYNYFYKLNQINNLKKNYEKLNNIKYDVVIAMRPDIYFLTDNDPIIHNLNLIKENVLIFPGSDLNRDSSDQEEVINDHLCIGNSDSINFYSKLYKNINYYLTKYDTSEKIVYKYLLNNSKIISYKIDKTIKYKLVLSIANSISISGDSGSGKTTMCKIINSIFSETLQLECDRYHKWCRGDPMWKDITHLNPEANYLVKMRKDFFDLKIGNDIYQVDYDHSSGKFTDPSKIKSKKNIILCGLHTLYDQDIVNSNNLNIYLDPSPNLKIYWKIKRDVEERGYSIKTVINKIKEREKDYHNYIKPQRKSADLIIHFYLLDDLDYNKISNESKIGLKLLSKNNCFTKLIKYLNIEYTSGIEIDDQKDDKIYYFMDLKQPIPDNKLLEFIKDNNLIINSKLNEYQLLIQIVILLYFL